MKEVNLPLTLTGMEVIFLSDSLRFDNATLQEYEVGDQMTVYRELLLRLGSAYVELVKFDKLEVGPIDVYISEEMAWLLRSKVRTGDTGIDGQTRIGHVLLVKLYSLLLQFNSQFADFKPTEEPEPEENSKLVRFAEWKAKREAENASSTTKDTDPNPTSHGTE